MIKGGLKHLSRVSDVLFRKLRVERDITIFPDDVFLTSYPRSGNTWMRFLVGNLLHQEKPVTFLNMEGLVPGYEDLLTDPTRELAKVARILGLEPEPERLARAVELSSADRMRKLEKE